MLSSDLSNLSSEYLLITEECGLVDRSERGKLALTGTGALEFLGGQVTNELSDLRPGEGRYAAFLTHKGKMLGDLRILAAASEDAQPHQGEPPAPEGQAVTELLLDTERVALQALFDMIRRFKVGYDVQLHKRTLESGIYSLIGARAREVAARADPCSADRLPALEHSHTSASISGRPVRLISTPAGLDVLFDAGDHDAVSRGLLQAGAQAVSEEAAEILRVEHGRPRYGLDIDESTIPQEAGLNERAVSFTKGCYVGQETVARLYYKGKPNRHLRGLRLSEPALSADELRLDGRPVGRLGSAVQHPVLGPIGLALVRREAQPGAEVSVGEAGCSGEIVALPFELL